MSASDAKGVRDQKERGCFLKQLRADFRVGSSCYAIQSGDAVADLERLGGIL